MKTRAHPHQRPPGPRSGFRAGAEERARRAARALRRNAVQDRESNRQVDEFLQRGAGARG
jgi:hypothetical protein